MYEASGKATTSEKDDLVEEVKDQVIRMLNSIGLENFRWCRWGSSLLHPPFGTPKYYQALIKITIWF